MKKLTLALVAASIGVVATPGVAHAQLFSSPRAEYREGLREIARERAEMRRDIINSGSAAEARAAYREGMREIQRERREMRREVRRAVRQRYIGRRIAGVILGEILRPSVVGRPPARPPQSDLCWFWSNARRDAGYWYYCTGD